MRINFLFHHRRSFCADTNSPYIKYSSVPFFNSKTSHVRRYYLLYDVFFVVCVKLFTVVSVNDNHVNISFKS